jgi:RNA polymerase sigma factor (sigma-70 family)
VVRIHDQEITSLWQEHKEKLRARITTLVGNNDSVEDLLQGLFLKVYPKAAKLNAHDAPKYFMRAASNVARDYLRRQSRWKWVPADWCRQEETPYDHYLLRERQDHYDRRVLPAVRSLPARKQQAIDCYLSDETRTAAARRIGALPTTLRSREESALEDLRERLDYRRTASLLDLYSGKK